MPEATQCSLVTVEHHCTATIKGQVPYAKMREAHMSARAKLNAALPTLNAGATGRFVTRTGMPSPTGLYMEIGIEVEHVFVPVGDIVPGELPAGRAARYQLIGSFEQLPQAWPFLLGWVKEQGLTTAGINWEIYGATVSDPAQQETDLYALLA
jgi:effector-binding domain-containing protein